MINVYMDDIRHCPAGFVLARTVDECIALLDECEIGILSLDHDMGWNQPTGYDVTKYIVAQNKYPREIYLHTSSAIGRSNMYQLLVSNKPEDVAVHPHAMPEDVLARAARNAKTSS